MFKCFADGIVENCGGDRYAYLYKLKAMQKYFQVSGFTRKVKK